MMAEPYTLARLGTREAIALEDELAALYVAVYSEPPYNSEGVYKEEGFRQRNQTQLRAPGFRLITARVPGGELVGFAFGFTFAADTWWSGGVSPESVGAVEKFALIELVVAKGHRGRGLSRRLMAEALAGRQEPFATLCAHPDAQPARDMYNRWGWSKVATIGLADDRADILVLDLTK